MMINNEILNVVFSAQDGDLNATKLLNSLVDLGCIDNISTDELNNKLLLSYDLLLSLTHLDKDINNDMIINYLKNTFGNVNNEKYLECINILRFYGYTLLIKLIENNWKYMTIELKDRIKYNLELLFTDDYIVNPTIISQYNSLVLHKLAQLISTIILIHHPNNWNQILDISIQSINKLLNYFEHEYNSSNINTNIPYKVQYNSTSTRHGASPPEVTTSVPLAVEASSNYLPVNGNATPGDRGDLYPEEQEMSTRKNVDVQPLRTGILPGGTGIVNSEEQTSTVVLPSASSIYLPVNGNTTPGDRGGSEGMDWTSSGPGSDLRELEGEVNRGAVCKTTSGGTASGKTSDGKELMADNVGDMILMDIGNVYIPYQLYNELLLFCGYLSELCSSIKLMNRRGINVIKLYINDIFFIINRIIFMDLFSNDNKFLINLIMNLSFIIDGYIFIEFNLDDFLINNINLYNNYDIIQIFLNISNNISEDSKNNFISFNSPTFTSSTLDNRSVIQNSNNQFPSSTLDNRNFIQSLDNTNFIQSPMNYNQKTSRFLMNVSRLSRMNYENINELIQTIMILRTLIEKNLLILMKITSFNILIDELMNLIIHPSLEITLTSINVIILLLKRMIKNNYIDKIIDVINIKKFILILYLRSLKLGNLNYQLKSNDNFISQQQQQSQSQLDIVIDDVIDDNILIDLDNKYLNLIITTTINNNITLKQWIKLLFKYVIIDNELSIGQMKSFDTRFSSLRSAIQNCLSIISTLNEYYMKITLETIYELFNTIKNNFIQSTCHKCNIKNLHWTCIQYILFDSICFIFESTIHKLKFISNDHKTPNWMKILHKQQQIPPIEVQSNSPSTRRGASSTEVQSNSFPLAVEASSNLLSLKSKATPGDRGDLYPEEQEMSTRKNVDVQPLRTGILPGVTKDVYPEEQTLNVFNGPQVETSSGLPVADLREAEGQLNRRGTTPSGKTSGGTTSSGEAPCNGKDITSCGSIDGNDWYIFGIGILYEILSMSMYSDHGMILEIRRMDMLSYNCIILVYDSVNIYNIMEYIINYIINNDDIIMNRSSLYALDNICKYNINNIIDYIEIFIIKLRDKFINCNNNRYRNILLESLIILISYINNNNIKRILLLNIIQPYYNELLNINLIINNSNDLLKFILNDDVNHKNLYKLLIILILIIKKPTTTIINIHYMNYLINY